jgi:hypothetical protein
MQWFVLPMRDSGTGRVQGHAERRSVEDARHLRIGETPIIAGLRVARRCGRDGWIRRMIDRVTHGDVLASGRLAPDVTAGSRSHCFLVAGF